MKKISFAFLAIGLTLSGFAQTIDTSDLSILPRHFFHLNIGNAIAGGAGVLSDSTIKTDRTRSAVVGLGYDYQVNQRLSIGVVTAYQRINTTVNDTLDVLLEEGAINRIYTGTRLIVNYGKGDVVRFYSGVRAGLVFFNTDKISGPDASNSRIEDRNNRYRISAAIIPIAMKLHFTESFGAHIQTNFGAPYWFNLGFNYSLQ